MHIFVYKWSIETPRVASSQEKQSCFWLEQKEKQDTESAGDMVLQLEN